MVSGLLASEATPTVIRVAWLIPALPAFGAVVLLLFGPRLKRASGPIATIMMVAAAVVSTKTFFDLIEREEEARTFVQRIGSWISAGSFSVNFDYRIDPLSITMILVVTGVGALIHLYSVGYMRDDPREGRFFAYMNLFAASMLVLVMANNFLLLFVGWELVGLCSYLLIGFWFDREGVGSAAKKAFITNRVGDFAFMIAIFLVFQELGTLDFGAAFASAELLDAGLATAVALLLLGGAAGKSAQIPLYVWLPDAMAGPTPVSALIHAATMVTAGVYMVARTHVFFDISGTALDVVAIVGVATALVAGLIAVAQDDIKRVLAYSTVSQLGFMFVGLGVGAYAAGIFHLVTHAFFKALLFLGAGAVMHAMHDQTDITRMGNLWRKIPWTMVTFVMGWLAIVGFPGTSGFFSKDQILEAAYTNQSYVVWGLGLAATVLTGFYMTRLVTLTFFSRKRYGDDLHPHESPVSMVFPLVVLGVLALIGGLINIHPESGRLVHFLVPSIGEHEVHHGALSALQLSGIATVAGLFGAVVALVMYGGRRFDWERRRENPGLAFRAVRNKLGVDEAYQFAFTSLGRLGASALAFVVDLKVIDGVVNGVGTMTAKAAAVGRRVQTGLVRTYALAVVGGGVVVLALLLGRTVR